MSYYVLAIDRHDPGVGHRLVSARFGERLSADTYLPRERVVAIGLSRHDSWAPSYQTADINVALTDKLHRAMEFYAIDKACEFVAERNNRIAGWAYRVVTEAWLRDQGPMVETTEVTA